MKLNLNRELIWQGTLSFAMGVVFAFLIMELQAARKNERELQKEVFRLQSESSKAVAEFRKPLTQAAQPQPESWVAPLMRPQGGSK